MKRRSMTDANRDRWLALKAEVVLYFTCHSIIVRILPQEL